MNQFKNGTLLVVIATIVTAVLILMTSRDSAVTSTDEHVVVTANETTQLKTSDTGADKETNQTEEITIEVAQQQSTEQIADPVVEIEKLAAPEGPFNKALVKQEQATNDETDVVDSVEATADQHEVLNHIVQPIWMDQKLGDFKSIEKGEVVFQMMPTSPDGLQGENPAQVITDKSDKFLPATISAKYNYQQMPMYNGGYYIAPMPSYLMPAMLPGKAVPNIKK